MAGIKAFHTDKIDDASIKAVEADASLYIASLRPSTLVQVRTTKCDNGFVIVVMDGLNRFGVVLPPN